MTRTRARRWRSVGVVAAAVLPLSVVAACSSAGSSSSTGASTSTSSSSSSTSAASSPASSASASGSATATSVLGTPHQATGSPITIGFVSGGVGNGVDNSSETPAAEAAVAYANAYLNGIDGHVIDLKTCVFNQTPAGATSCGNQMVADKVSVVLYGTMGQAPQLYAAVDPAKIPIMGWEEIDGGMVSGGTDGRHFVVTNLIGEILGAPAKLAQMEGIKKSALVVVNVPAAVEGAQELGNAFFKAAGVGLDIVAITPGTADMTPQIQTALSAGAKSFGLIGDVAFCTSALKAIRTLGFTGLVSSQSTCLGTGTTTAQAIPGGLAGVSLITAETTESTAPQIELYNAVMAKYSASTKLVDVTGGSYGVVLALVRALNASAPKTLDANGVTAALKAAPPEQLPLSAAGVTFACNGKAVAVAPGVCASALLDGAYNAAGDITKFTPFDPGSVMTAG
jgi:branched-chain amino acid transport system substrate-binding protein